MNPALIFILIFFSTSCWAQLVPGETYYDSTGFVEYRAGNLPIILSAPHGGDWQPDSIPDRDCVGCVFQIDAFTRVITWDLVDKIVELTGCFPHMVMNRLHRVKFDANRDIADAADGNAIVEEAWRGYHDFIDLSKDEITSSYGRGLFLDLHGHAHTVQRIELGYLLSREALQMTDDEINALLNEASISTLSSNNINRLSLAGLLRGEESFGSLLHNKGLPSVPSLEDPYPLDNEAYFTGGFNTVRHGSKEMNGTIDAIQIEMNQDIRFDEDNRRILVDSLAQSILDYLALHYFEEFSPAFCDLNTSLASEPPTALIELYPNPAYNYVSLSGLNSQSKVLIYDMLGQLIINVPAENNSVISIENLISGQYFVKALSQGEIIFIGRFTK